MSTDAGGDDPSMEDILASIRRILDEGGNEQPEGEPASAAIEGAAGPAAHQAREELLLDASMLVDDAPRPAMPWTRTDAAPHGAIALPAPASAGTTGLLGANAAHEAAASMQSLMRAVAPDRGMSAYHGGPTLEDIVRAELRPLLESWLNTHLPPLVQRLVQTEIERVSAR